MRFTSFLGLCGLVFVLAAGALPDTLPASAVFLTEQETASVHERMAKHAWAREVADELLRQADMLAAETLDIPHKEGQWSHYYTCAECGGRLSPRTPTEHVCKVCGKLYTGWPYDAVYVTFRHSHWLRGLETLGWAYTLKPKPAYAQRARAILLEYASFYENLELHDRNGKHSKSQARLYAQTLDEAVTACHIALGYDRLRAAPCFSDEDHAAIASGLLRPMAATIRPNRAGISNWQSWHNAGAAALGFVLGDRELVDWAINGAHGFRFQMEESVLDSGMWYEESPSYHWYALSAHVYLMEAAARAGVDLYHIPVVKRMFDAPVRLLYPDKTLPALHDSNRGSITGQRRFYEIAWKRYQDPDYPPLLEPRDSTWALFWGAPVPDDVVNGGLGLGSSNSLSEGLAVMRGPDGETAVFFDYGKGRSGHVQPAKLNLLAYAQGDERFVDPGRLPYANPLHKGWYRQTVAHNTVVVGKKSQRRTAGTLRAWANTPDFTLVRATANTAYEGVTLDRTLIMMGRTVADVFQCAAEEPTIFDLPLHVRGEFHVPENAEPVDSLGDGNGYQYLEAAHRIPADTKKLKIKTDKNKHIMVWPLDEAPLFSAVGFGYTPREKVPLLMRRKEGRAACFAAVYQLDGAGAPPEVRFEAEPVPALYFSGYRFELGEATRVVEPGSDTPRVLEPGGGP